MRRYWLFVFVVTVCLPACTARPRPLPVNPPAAVPISGAEGAALSSEAGPLWVLLSGVDEHGLVESHEISLLVAPEPAAAVATTVHTGTAAAVHEIRQAGPQNLWRFYRVRTVDGRSGWVPDYFIRRLAYLFSAEAETIPLHDAPAGTAVYQAGQVTPVVLLEPTRTDWWQVATVDGTISGWVATAYVKESPAWEFLLDLDHEH
jgi:hypothetical protein